MDISLLTESHSKGRLLGSKRKKFAASSRPRTSGDLDLLLDVK